MPIFKNITHERRCQLRTLIVRAIEDAIVLLVLCVGIWLVCTIVGSLLSLLGVA